MEALPPVPKQVGARPSNCSCDGLLHHRRATTEVVTTNMKGRLSNWSCDGLLHHRRVTTEVVTTNFPILPILPRSKMGSWIKLMMLPGSIFPAIW
ncbi:MAG: hypothetical protein ACRC8Y_16805 [Chroococcales cyanobacterium]